jgi:hypothetical protein
MTRIGQFILIVLMLGEAVAFVALLALFIGDHWR